MNFQLEAGEPIPTAIKRILTEQVDAIEQWMRHSEEGRAEAVHNARKSCKRIRAVLRLVRDEIGEDVYRRQNLYYRDTARLLSPIRDSAVLVETIDSLKQADGLSSELLGVIREELVNRRDAILAERLDRQNVMAQVAERMQYGRASIADLPLRQEDFTALAGGLRRVYRRGRKQMALAYAQPRQAQNFHEWRKQVKYLWHHLEILQPVWPVVLAGLAQELHRLSDFLGDAHDLAALEQIVQAEPQTLAPNFSDRPRLLILIEQRQQALEQAARPLGQRIYHEKPGAFTRRLYAYWRCWQP